MKWLTGRMKWLKRNPEGSHRPDPPQRQLGCQASTEALLGANVQSHHNHLAVRSAWEDDARSDRQGELFGLASKWKPTK